MSKRDEIVKALADVQWFIDFNQTQLRERQVVKDALLLALHEEEERIQYDAYAAEQEDFDAKMQAQQDFDAKAMAEVRANGGIS